MDNAIKAVAELESGGIIDVALNVDKGRLLKKIANNYLGEINTVGGEIKTSSVEKLNHGFGLSNVREIVEKYNGIFNV